MLRLSWLLRASSPTAMTPRTALKILALSPSADLSHSAIKKAYVKQTLLCHPDLFPDDPLATEKFRNLSDALRVALKALEMRQGHANSGCRNSRTGEDREDSQAALEALRRAILMYREHRKGALGGTGTSTPHSSSSTDNRVQSTRSEHIEDAAFFSPSLEYVSAVCQREARAMLRVRMFCKELPGVLCGSGRAALFEAVAFFHARYVEATSECVLRFSKNLPVIVRRVVRNRRKHIRNKHTKLTTGIATGNRPREQRIEDMAMKPLVLVGALIFDLPGTDTTGGGGGIGTPTTGKHEKEAKIEMDTEELDGSVASTCGVTRRRDIAVNDELTCVIYPSDSITDVTEKLGAWEAASYERLKLELAIVDVGVFLSGMLGLSPLSSWDVASAAATDTNANDDHSLAIAPHLHVGHAVTAQVLRTLQQLATVMCEAFDDALDDTQRVQSVANGHTAEKTVTPVEVKVDHILATLHTDESRGTGASSTSQRLTAYAEAESRSAADDRQAQESLSLPVLIAECRRLAALAAPGLRGSITVTWRDEEDLLPATTTVKGPTFASETANTESASKTQGKAGAKAADPSRGFRVGRHADCCTAEMVAFAVSLELCADLRVFLLRLRTALKTVVLEHVKAHRILHEVLKVRDATVQEEFIPEDSATHGDGKPTPQTERNQKTDGNGGNDVDVNDEENRRYRYRPPIFNFARTHNMVTSRELAFWRHLHANREYLAAHSAAASTMNVYLDCLPSTGSSSGSDPYPSQGSDDGADGDGVKAISGWVGESADDGGQSDDVVLTTAELEGEPGNDRGGAFRQWLEDVVEQSSMNKECRTLLDEAGIAYVQREPTLPLPNYLSFLKVYVRASAVRSVLEAAATSEARRHSHDGERDVGGGSNGKGRPRAVRSEDIGITIVVGHRCDVRDGGRLLVPWSMDPAVLLALLADGGPGMAPGIAA